MPRRPTGSLERAVLEVLWSRPEGATPAEVRASLADDLAYTTVMTVLARLWQKGLAVREHEGRGFRYRASASEADLAAERMRALLDPVNDRRLALSRFVDGLSKRDERALRQILEDLDR
jgi:predicted transcriptional regulator